MLLERRILEYIALDMVSRRVFTRAGYPASADIPEDDAALLQRLMPQMRALLAPAIALGEIVAHASALDKVILDNTMEINSVSLARTMRGATQITLYAATIGNEIERMATQCSNDRKHREALLWDSFGSEAAEALARHVSLVVRQRASTAGHKTTMRYSPGYGDLALEFNAIILDLLDAREIGIATNEAGLLLPRKSTTGLIGWIHGR